MDPLELAEKLLSTGDFGLGLRDIVLAGLGRGSVGEVGAAAAALRSRLLNLDLGIFQSLISISGDLGSRGDGCVGSRALAFSVAIIRDFLVFRVLLLISWAELGESL